MTAFLDALDKGERPPRGAVSRRLAPAPAGAHRLRRRAPVQGRRGAEARRAWRCGRSTSTRPDAATPRPRRIGVDPASADRIYARVARQADARTGRGLPHRLRGRLRQPARITRRTATRSSPRTRSPPACSDGTLPPSIGIRIKPLSEELKRRSLRTFDLFLTRLLERTDGVLPPNFVVTLPKITAPGAGGGARVGVRRVRILARAAAGHAALRADDRNDAVGVRGRRHRRAAAA